MNKLLIILTSFTFLTVPLAVAAIEIDEQRKLFKQVKVDLLKNKSASYIKHKNKLNNYILKPHLDYLYLNKRIKSLKSHDLKRAITTYQDWPFTDKLKTRFIYEKARNKEWSEIKKVYKPVANTPINCVGLLSHVKTNDHTEWHKFTKEIWMQGKSQPSECDPLFKEFEEHNYLTQNMVWKRIKLAIEEENYRLALYLSNKLSDKDRKIANLWVRTHKAPHLLKNTNLYSQKHPAYVEMITHGIAKLSKDNIKNAILVWKKYATKHQFNKRHWNTVVRAIAIELAHDNHPQSKVWLAKIPPEYRNSTVAQVTLRLALKTKDWKLIKNTYEKLSQLEKQNEKWQYWYARALESTGNRQAGQKILFDLSKQRNYYGFLASKKLLRPYSIKNESIEIPNSIIKKVQNNVHIRRALEWKNLNEEHLANQEWYTFLRTASEIDRHAAALVAAKNKEAHWAIMTLAKAENKNNLNLRFPRKYSKKIFAHASNHEIDPAWVFAVTRQESAFTPTARSSAGALGLMQLMPRTAKMMAKMSQVSLRSKYELLKADKNIYLGSAYLRYLLEKYNDNRVLATAAYNAGPSRVSEWLPEKEMSADIWIETIPFYETRNYVQNVIAYTIIYKDLLQDETHSSLLAQNIRGTIPPRVNTIARR